MTTDELIDRCFTELDTADMSDEVQAILIAALMGESELEQHIDGSFTPPPRQPTQPAASPQRAYLRAVNVRGFRGIGTESTLKLTPGPGLTLVVGRNGSGKSSFAEAVEFLLSGTSFRWAGRPTKEWEDGWRNLHCTDTTKVAAEFVVDGVPGAVRLGAEWPIDGDLRAAQLTTRAVGNAATEDPPDLGWTSAVVTHRPLLSYPELARIADAGPSKLYDSMAAILGLDSLVDVSTRLNEARKVADERGKAAKATRDDLSARLDASTDERAAGVRTAITAKKVDVIATRALVLDSLTDVAGSGGVAALHRAVAAELPSIKHVNDAAAALDAAHQQLTAGLAETVERSERHLQLLEVALVVHDDEGDGVCPVCRSGPLDAEWHVQAADEVVRLRDAVSEVKRLRAAHREALAKCQTLVTHAASLTASLDGSMEIDLTDLRDAIAAVAGIAGAHGPRKALDHWGDLAAAHDLVKDAARTQLDKLDDSWRPLATDLLKWLDEADAAEQSKVLAQNLKTAGAWVTALTDQIRDERFGPIAGQVKETWAHLRHASNVQIDDLRLSGSRTRRRVDLDVSVDGSSTSALAVMSQGELNALALSLFLPRATLADSPFGFVVIDDPVQAMDPARVDGLATVLAKAAETHQVIVFTHDDRLPDSVRRLGLPARMVAVQRGEQSSVKTAPLLDPVARYLDDARAIVRSEGVEIDLVERVVAGLCRQAVEAAAVDVYRRKALERGDRHDVVEATIDEATTFIDMCALAIYDDRAEAGKVLGYFSNKSKRLGDAAGDCARGAHGGALKIEPKALPKQAEELCKALGYVSA